MSMKREYLLFDACSYCFGPAGSLAPILRELYNLLGNKYKFVFAGCGSSMELMKKSTYISEFYEMDTEDFFSLDEASDLICGATAVITNTNPVMAIFARSKGVKTFFVDILPWMHNSVAKKLSSIENLNDNKRYLIEHPEAGDLLASVDAYLYQRYLVDFNIEKRYENAICVPPISQTMVSTGKVDVKDRIVISTGGLFSPDIEAEKILIGFGNQIIESAIKAAKSCQVSEILVCGPKVLQEKLDNFDYDFNISVICMEHDEFLETISNSRYLAIVPGLTTIYEAFLTQNRTLLLPATNYSQILQLEAVKEAGLGMDLTCEDIFAENSKDCIEAGEIDGTAMMLAHMSNILDNGKLKQVVDDGFGMLLDDRGVDTLTMERRQYVINMGNDGAKDVAMRIYNNLVREK